MEVDHIVPETLIGKADLADVLESLGLPQDFDLNTFANWMPAHRACNRVKSSTVFKSTPIIQLSLQQAAKRQTKTEEIHDSYVTNRKVSLAMNLLTAAYEQGELGDKQKTALAKIAAGLSEYHDTNRAPEDRGKPIMLAPWLTVLSEGREYMVLQSARGMVGVRPSGENIHPSWDCPNCGVTGWNGARCISCGMLDDGD